MRIGIDYGSKSAGTTVIAYQKEELIYLVKSAKKQDADEMIMGFVQEHQPEVVGIDAPLSLPGVYSGLSDFDDYHYRVCDKELKAMSPMFLGGLTARAMKLQSRLNRMGVKVYETYPVQTAKLLSLKAFGYRTKMPDYMNMLRVLQEKGVCFSSEAKVETSHDLDSVLALIATNNIATKEEQKKGDSREGLIYY